jgi:hypothetical protein
MSLTSSRSFSEAATVPLEQETRIELELWRKSDFILSDDTHDRLTRNLGEARRAPGSSQPRYFTDARVSPRP